MNTQAAKIQKCVILGVSGGLGSALARELVKNGKSVIGINRSGMADSRLVPEEVDIRGIDIYDENRLLEVLDSVDIVYNCLNLPYSKWSSELVSMTSYLIKQLQKLNLPLVVADNLYMYAENLKIPLHEDLAYEAQGRKGRVRAQVARLYSDAHNNGMIKMVIVRGPDYYGPGALHSSYYGDRLFSKILRNKRASLIGEPHRLHTIIYVEDFARAMIQIGEDSTTYGQIWHAPSTSPISQQDFVKLAYEIAGLKPILPGSITKLMLGFAGIFNREIREVKEMLYEFEKDYLVSHMKFMTKYPDFHITTFEEGISSSIRWYQDVFNIT